MIKNNHTNCSHPKRARSAAYTVKTIFVLLAVTLATLWASPADINCTKAGALIILENGRKKPLDTYARNKLLQFSGKRHVGKLSACTWMTRLLFDPASVNFTPVFLINNPEIAVTLGISPQKKRRYSYAELSGAAEKLQQYHDRAQKTSPANQSVFDREILRIYNNLIEFRNLAATIQYMTPDIDFYIPATETPVAIPQRLSDPSHPPSFLDMLRNNGFLSVQMQRIGRAALDSLPESDRHILLATKRMYDLNQSLEPAPPYLIPFTTAKGEEWTSPWGLIAQIKSEAPNNPAFEAFTTCANAYQTGNQSSFDSAVLSFIKAQLLSNSGNSIPNPSLELLYNRLNPFSIAKIVLGLSALMSLILLFSHSRPLRGAAAAGILSALALSTTGIILRMIIMHHPPVTNLYETFIFVAWTTIIIGLFIERIGITSIGYLTASLAGFVFFHVAGRYAADGDTMGMLAAVLDSGFWLTTHIITIALGYAGCMGAGFIGHLYLVHRIAAPTRTTQAISIARAVYGVLAFGLLFTTLGTVTGGMWADQAWGRFWGWDPKENGALLIILWCTIIFHLRLTRRIADAGTAAGAVFSSVLVMCTWIGVNLLGTGLHSYGFTSSGARMLAGYCGFELLFLLVAAAGIRLRLKQPGR